MAEEAADGTSPQPPRTWEAEASRHAREALPTNRPRRGGAAGARAALHARIMSLESLLRAMEGAAAVAPTAAATSTTAEAASPNHRHPPQVLRLRHQHHAGCRGAFEFCCVRAPTKIS